MPLAGAFVVFASQVSGAAGEQNTEIRGTLLDDSGRRVDTCGQPQEMTYASPPANVAPIQRYYAASIAPPAAASDDQIGIITYIGLKADRYDSTSSGYVNGAWQVLGTSVGAIGCLGAGVTSFQMSDEAVGNPVSPPVAVPLGRNRFVLLWAVLASPANFLRARVFDLSLLGPQYIPTLDPLTGLPNNGKPVSLRPSGEQPISLDALALPDNQFALAWASAPTFSGGLTIRFAIYNDRLALVGKPVVLDDGYGCPSMPDDVRIAIAHDGAQFMVAWSQRDATVSRAYGRMVDGTGAPTSDRFRLGTRTEGEEGGVALVAQRGGGFVAAWEEQQASGGEESGVSLRMAAFSPDGTRRFVNQACGNADFRLNRPAAGNQSRVSLATLANGTVEAVWTDGGSTEVNSRGTTEMRSVAIVPRTFLPLE